MINLFSDFGSSDIYVGQMKAAIWRIDPTMPLIDLLHDAADFDIEGGAHLLAALWSNAPAEVTVAVVDPGVGGQRRPIAIETDAGWLIGPDNGLLSVAAARTGGVRMYEIQWQPQVLSDTFHGRDLFAPVAAMIVAGRRTELGLQEISALEHDFGGADLARVIYIDHYGNVLTGMQASKVARNGFIQINHAVLGSARCFSDVPKGTAFWYENSLGLIELAVNGGNAAKLLRLELGATVNRASSVA